eukprot:m.82284 g.82284  ORF g.82284 m.82284 type:complete len:385 (-) comp14613_c0_seq1:2092-3246(-)
MARHALLPAIMAALCYGQLSPTLPSSMTGHDYVFLVGAHHSGTTLTTLILCTHPDAACIRDSKAPEDEGNHVQKVYKQEYKLGGAMKYAFHPLGHLVETDPLLTDENREKIIGSWQPFWNLSKRVLVEKSPRHTIMTRFLQALATPDASRFLVIMRHPLAASHYQWWRNRKTDEAKATCGRPWIEHWLELYRYVKEDVPHLRQVAVFQYERLLAGSPKLSDSRILTQGWLDALYRFMGLPTGLVKAGYQRPAKEGESMPEGLYAKLEMDTAVRRRLLSLNISRLTLDEDAFLDSHRDADTHHGNQQRRQLLEFYGRNRYEVKINDRLVYNWVPQWKDMVDMDSEACQSLVRDHEAELNTFGYSLKDLTFAQPPLALSEHHLKLT